MIMTLKAIDCSEKKDWGGGGYFDLQINERIISLSSVK